MSGEIDGDSHVGKQKYDLERQKRLVSWGLKVIIFYDHDVMKFTGGVVSKIKEPMRELESQYQNGKIK